LNAIEENIDESEEQKTPASANPFDIKSEAFCFPVCSPSIFATFSRNSTDKQRPFRWSIEHLSVLFPADIDETSIPDSWTDPDQELKAQKAIDTFFSQNSIVPSPWSPELSSKGGRKIKMRRTIRHSSPANSFTNNDASTQTKLTIPPSVDLEALLGGYFTYQEDNDLNCCSAESSPKESELMNTSSLRRKLFVAKEENFTPKW
ncbi:protein aurora borealis-like, partial [Uloborus diversus]|uniref:protein aurora borealis-like n=1 Tax=Uloborus diversus TaxID=327109 RepID=UPI002409252D